MTSYTEEQKEFALQIAQILSGGNLDKVITDALNSATDEEHAEYERQVREAQARE